MVVLKEFDEHRIVLYDSSQDKEFEIKTESDDVIFDRYTIESILAYQFNN